MTVDLINSGNKQPRRGCGIVAQKFKKPGAPAQEVRESGSIIPAQWAADESRKTIARLHDIYTFLRKVTGIVTMIF